MKPALFPIRLFLTLCLAAVACTVEPAEDGDYAATDDDDFMADDDDSAPPDDDDDAMSDDDDDAPPTCDDVLAPACPLPDFETVGGYTVETVVFDEPDGFALEADVYVPDGEGPFPGVAIIHGGGWIQNNRFMMDPVSQHYAQRGMVVMNLEYRLVNPDVKMDRLVRDSVCAVRWLKARAVDYGLQPECLGVLGESAGGHLAALVALVGDDPEFQTGCEAAGDTDALVRFAMPYYGVHDFDAFIESLGGGSDYLIPMLFGETLDPYEYDPIRYAYLRPEVDFFVAHGDADDLVPLDQSITFAHALEKSCHRVETFVVPGGPHGFVAGGFNGESNAIAQPEAEAFLIRTLSGQWE